MGFAVDRLEGLLVVGRATESRLLIYSDENQKFLWKWPLLAGRLTDTKEALGYLVATDA